MLVRLEDTDLQSRLSQAESGVAQAQAVLDQARIEESRLRSAVEKRAVAEIELERAVNVLKGAEANAARARQAQVEARTVLEYATIRSTMDGVVVDKRVNTGDTVSPGQVVVTLLDPTRMQLVASVRESLSRRLRVGGLVSVKLNVVDIESDRDPRPRGITEAVFLEQLEKSAGATVAEFAKRVVDEVERSPDLWLTWSKAGPAIWWDDDSGERQAGLLRLRASGEFSSTIWLPSFCAAHGLPMSIADEFQNGLVKLVPGARRVERGTQGLCHVQDAGGSNPKLVPLAARRDEFWSLLRQTTRALAAALADRAEGPER